MLLQQPTRAHVAALVTAHWVRLPDDVLDDIGEGLPGVRLPRRAHRRRSHAGAGEQAECQQGARHAPLGRVPVEGIDARDEVEQRGPQARIDQAFGFCELSFCDDEDGVSAMTRRRIEL